MDHSYTLAQTYVASYCINSATTLEPRSTQYSPLVDRLFGRLFSTFMHRLILGSILGVNSRYCHPLPKKIDKARQRYYSSQMNDRLDKTNNREESATYGPSHFGSDGSLVSWAGELVGGVFGEAKDVPKGIRGCPSGPSMGRRRCTQGRQGQATF